jgi:stalled ribosome alternative rescue factor ArfA
VAEKMNKKRLDRIVFMQYSQKKRGKGSYLRKRQTVQGEEGTAEEYSRVHG